MIRGAARRLLAVADERRWLDDRTAPATKIAQRSLFQRYRALASEGGRLPSVWDTGFRVFSQFDEDGVALFLLAAAGDGPRKVLDFGAGNGVHASNCANLLLNLACGGVLIDADADKIAWGERFYARHPDTKEQPPTLVASLLTRENVNDVVSGAGLEGEVDFLSIDVDGNDYWLWHALECVRPRFVVIEGHPEAGRGDEVAPYASLAALVRLGQELGFRLVGANQYGFNVFFAREDVATAVPAISLDALFERAGI